MDACARIRGVPLKNRAIIRKETVREGSAVSLRSLLRNKKELCNVLTEPPSRDTQYLSEIQFVCLPSYSDGEDFTLQALASVSAEISDLLRSLHIHTLKNEEVLLLKDSRRLLERKDSISQPSWSKAMCILRQNPAPQINVCTILGLLSRYTAGLRYGLELQSMQRSVSEAGEPEDDDTNMSVSSIDEDFVTAFEHLDEEDNGEYSCSTSYNQRNQRDVASQTVPSHFKDISGSHVLVSSFTRKSISKQKPSAEMSAPFQRFSGPLPADVKPFSMNPQQSPSKGCVTSASLTESDDSDCSSPSPIIFLDEVGYQKSLKAKLDIPTVPNLKEGVEDSDSEVSEFFDSFDRFDDLDPSSDAAVKMPVGQGPSRLTKKRKATDKAGSKYVSRGCSTTAMNPHKFDHPKHLPANVKKPTPLKPGSPYGLNSDVPDSPRPVRTSCEESGGLFSPVHSSAFSPLGDGGTLEYFWKADGDGSELPKPQDLCSLYKTYSDFANNLSKEILGSVCGYSSPVDMQINKNLSCVCYKEFQNTSGHLMKLADIQETVTITKSQQKSQSLKDGIQRFATDLVEMSLGSALRDLQKGVSSCTTTLCHLAARLTSSVFQMAFHEIGMRHAYVLKERAINGLAGFLVGEAVASALKEFLFVKKQIFNNTVARFAADLAEELVFEGIMEVCQFSHPSTPLTPSDWSFEQEEEVVSSYASDLSESVLQEAFIELSQADVTFTTQAAISVSLDNICYVSAEDASKTTKTCTAPTGYLGSQMVVEPDSATQDGCTVKKALFCVSGMASCVPVPVAGKAISHLQSPEETCQYKSSISHMSQTSPKRSMCSQGSAKTSTSDTSASTQTDPHPGFAKCLDSCAGHFGTQSISGEAPKASFQNFSGSMVDMIVGEAFDLMSSAKVKKKVEDCADFLGKTIGGRMPIPGQGMGQTQGMGFHSQLHSTDCSRSSTHDSCAPQRDSSCSQRGRFTDSLCPSSFQVPSNPESRSTEKVSCDLLYRKVNPVHKLTSEVHPVMMKDTLEVPSFEVSSRGTRKVVAEEMVTCSSGRKSSGSPGTPPSTPQQPSGVSNEKQIKQFSKKLKGKLAKEFSPATPPPTPHYQPATDVKEAPSDSDKADFMLKLMRSLSEEAGSNDSEEEDQESCPVSETGHPERIPNEGGGMVEKGALRYAERLACHIVSMATEMDTLNVNMGEGNCGRREQSKDSTALHSAQFSEQTLNSLWTYAGEMAGEVISDVKRMVSSRHCRHKTIKRGSDKVKEDPKMVDQRELSGMADGWSSDILASIQNLPHDASSGTMSEFSSSESVTEEYAGYLIKVLKKEGGSRELILDQYASRLAYRSIKSGLAHAAWKIKQRSPLRLHSSLRLHHDGSHGICGIRTFDSSPSTLAKGREGASSESGHCLCQQSEGMRRNEYMELVNFAESLAYNITRDVTRKLRKSSARLPKSLTDSCLYKKSKLEDMAESVVKATFSCSLLTDMENNRRYHSVGSLNDSNYNNGVMQVIEHYARKIVDDTLEMTLGPVGHLAAEDRRALEPSSYTEKISDGSKYCRYGQERECPFCRTDGRHHFQEKGTKEEPDAVCGLEIPQIHIDLDKRAVFAEEMVSTAIEKAKKELSSTSLNADSGIGHDGASFAESLTTEIMTSVLSNVCQTINLSAPAREGVSVTESTVSQQLSLSVGDDSLGSWSNLSFEEDHPDESSSFHHLSDSNGNSSSWSSLGLEGECYEEHLSFSPSDSDFVEEKEAETKDDSGGAPRVERGHGAGERALLVVSTDLREQRLDPQLRTVLQWLAASITELPGVQLNQHADPELQQLPAVVQRLRERDWRVGDLLQALLKFYEESGEHPGEDPAAEGRRRSSKSLFQWLQEHA